MQNGVQSQSFSSVQAVTPSDTAYNQFQALMATVTGNIAYEDEQGNTVTLAAVPIYTILPFSGQRVKATGTTATVLKLS